MEHWAKVGEVFKSKLHQIIIKMFQVLFLLIGRSYFGQL